MSGLLEVVLRLMRSSNSALLKSDQRHTILVVFLAEGQELQRRQDAARLWNCLVRSSSMRRAKSSKRRLK